MTKLGTKSRPAIIKFGPGSKQEEILIVIDKYGIQFIAGMEDEEDLSDLRTLISKEDFARIADSDARSNQAKISVQSLLVKAQSRQWAMW